VADFSNPVWKHLHSLIAAFATKCFSSVFRLLKYLK
jgi:hypothetical protein